jgi:hypothetical protein
LVFRENVPEEYQERCGKPLHFNGKVVMMMAWFLEFYSDDF